MLSFLPPEITEAGATIPAAQVQTVPLRNCDVNAYGGARTAFANANAEPVTSLQNATRDGVLLGAGLMAS
jgi:hypothetical protein